MPEFFTRARDFLTGNQKDTAPVNRYEGFTANGAVVLRDVWVRGANGRRVSRCRFRVVGCGAFRLDFDGDLGGEAEETALFLPVMRQVLTQPQQPARRQLDGMSACE
jgi:hypothetical protein